MADLTKTKAQSLTEAVSAIPDWIRKNGSREKLHRYAREGMADLIIHTPDPKPDEAAYNEAKRHLERLLELASIPLSREIVRETFRLVNGMIANPLKPEVFSFKVDAIFSVFHDYPACVFNAETARDLAVLSRFFPSGNEIEQVLGTARKRLDEEIANLNAIMGKGFVSKEDAVRAGIKRKHRKEAAIRQREAEEYRSRIQKIKNRFQPLDDLVSRIEKAVAMHVPHSGHALQGDRLITALEEIMNQVTDQEIKEILMERIRQIHAAQCMIRELTQAGVLTEKVA